MKVTRESLENRIVAQVIANPGIKFGRLVAVSLMEDEQCDSSPSEIIFELLNKRKIMELAYHLHNDQYSKSMYFPANTSFRF